MSKTHQPRKSFLDSDQQSYLDISFETKYGNVALIFNLNSDENIFEKILDAFNSYNSEEVKRISDEIKNEIFSRLARY